MTDNVVQTLLSVREGDRVRLEAERYEWSSPFEVNQVEEHSWRAPTEAVWISRSINLESQPTGAGRPTTKEFDVYTDGPAPKVGSYGELTAVEPADEDEDAEHDLDHPDWLARDARDIVDDSPVPRSLEGVLDAVERLDSTIDVHRRLGSGSLKATKDVLWELGLRDQAGRLLGGPRLQERTAELREVYVDE